jgi:hypothetical protein
MRSFLLLLLPAIMCVACVPTRETYFQPSGDGTRFTNGPCGGPQRHMRFQLAQGVALEVSLWKIDEGPEKGRLSMSVVYSVRSGSTLALATGISRIRYLPNGPDVEVQAKSEPSHSDKYIFYSVEVPNADATALAFLPPVPVVNGQVVPPTEITFRKVTSNVWQGVCQ